MKRILSFVLCLCLVFSMLPAQAFAAEETQQSLPAETMAAQTEPVAPVSHSAAPDPGLPENEELFAGYAQRLFYGPGPVLFGTAAGERLSGDEARVYEALRPLMVQLAAGKRTSSSIGLGPKGLTVSYDGKEYTADAEVTFTGTEFSSQSLSRVVTALLTDLPYEMYWYDKTSGCSMVYWTSGGTVLYIQFWFTVAGNYRGADENTVDTTLAKKAAEAAGNAATIVSKYAASSDYEKLVGYRDAICALVEYDYDAANSGSFKTDNDPWQLIHVFDGDDTTNVVCEGYSKAYMYLCDQSAFQGDTACYTVSGLMGGGAHMWNVVTLGGKNYLVDVTNSDAGSVGQNGGLFLVGTRGSVTEGYTFLNYPFTYDQKVINFWGSGEDSILSLAPEDYDPDGGSAAPNDPTDPTDPIDPEPPTDPTDPTDPEPPTDPTDPTEPEVPTDPEEEPVPSGTCGESLTWSLDAEGVLTISGTGAMTDYANSGEAPWADYKSGIVTVALPEGLTNIGSYAFADCTALTEIAIPDGVNAVGDWAFGACTALSDVTFAGDAPVMGENAFSGVTAAVHYPANYSAWNSVITRQYGGSLTWMPYVTPISQDDFEAALIDAVEAGEIYTLTRSLTLERDLEIWDDVIVGENGSITVPSGLTLTVGRQLDIDSGTITVKTGGGLRVEGILDVLSGTLTVESDTQLTIPQGEHLRFILGSGEIIGISPIVCYARAVFDSFAAFAETVGVGSNYPSYDVTIRGWDEVLPESLMIPSNVSLAVWGQEQEITLTLPSGACLLNWADLTLGLEDSEYKVNLVIEEGAELDNQGSILLENGTFTNNGTLMGNAPVDAATLPFTQADFLEDLLEAEEAGETYTLTKSLTLETDLELNVWMDIGEGGAITIPSGLTLTLSAGRINMLGGEITVKTGGTLALNGEEGCVRVAGGSLTAESGSFVTGGQRSVIEMIGKGTVTGVDASLLHGYLNGVSVHQAAEIMRSGAYATGYFALAEGNHVISEDLTIPAGFNLDLWTWADAPSHITVQSGATLTIQGVMQNDGAVNVSVEDGSGLEIYGGFFPGASLTVEKGAAFHIYEGAECYLYSCTMDVQQGAECSIVPGTLWVNTDMPSVVTGVEESLICSQGYAGSAAQLLSILESTKNYHTSLIRMESGFDLNADIVTNANTTLLFNGLIDARWTIPAGCSLVSKGILKLRDGAVLTVAEGASLTSLGTMEIEAGCTLINNGTFNIGTGDDTAACSAGAEGSCLTIAEGAVLINNASMTLESNAVLVNNGYLRLTGEAVLIIAEGAQLEGSGQMDLEDESQIVEQGPKPTIEITSNPSRIVSGGKAVLTASNPTGSALIWKLAESDREFASLTASGNTAVLTAKNVQQLTTVTVSVEAKDGSTIAGSIAVDIIPKASSVEISWENGVSAGTEATLSHDLCNPQSGSILLRGATQPQDAGDAVSWTVSDSKGTYVSYTINEDGTLTLSPNGKAGTVTVTAKAADGSGKTDKVTVKLVKLAQDIEITNAEEKLRGGAKLTLSTSIASDKTLTSRAVVWSVVDDEDLISSAFASITSKGVLTTRAVSVPTPIRVRVWLKENPNVSDTVDMMLHPAVDRVRILKNGEALTSNAALIADTKDGNLTFTADFHPNGCIEEGDWTLSDKKGTYVTYSENPDGTLIVKPTGKNGTVTITFKASDGSGKSTKVKLKLTNLTETVTLNQTQGELRSKKSLTLVPTLKDADGESPTSKAVSWTSSNPSAASVSSKGKVTAKTVYKNTWVTITATAKDGSGKSARADILIRPKEDVTLNILRDGENVTGTTHVVNIDNTLPVSVTAAVYDSVTDTDQSAAAEFTSSNKKVAAVDASGRITLLKPGSVTITAKAQGKTAKFKLKVVRYADSVKVTGSKDWLLSGKSITLKAAVTAVTGTPSSKAVTWTSSNPAVAAVSSKGKVTAAKVYSRETVTIRATAKDGSRVYGEYTLTVYPAATTVSIVTEYGEVLNNRTISVERDSDLKLFAIVFPFQGDDGAMQKVTWSSSNKKIATIDAEGNLTLLKKGTVTIKATADDGSKKSVSFKLTIVDPE